MNNIESRIEAIENRIQAKASIPIPPYFTLSDLPKETVIKATRLGIELGIFKVPDGEDINSLTDEQLYDAIMEARNERLRKQNRTSGRQPGGTDYKGTGP